MRITARELRMMAQTYPSGSAEFRECQKKLEAAIDALKDCSLVTNVLESELKVLASLMAAEDVERIEFKGGFRPVYAVAVVVAIPNQINASPPNSLVVPTIQAVSPRGKLWWVAGYDAMAKAMLEMSSRPPGLWLEPAVWSVKESPLGGARMPTLQRSSVNILGEEGA